MTNHLLTTCSPADLDLLLPHLKTIDLARGADLETPDQVIEHVYFPLSGIASVMAVSPTGDRLETGILGREGMTGCSVLQGVDRSPMHTFMQLPGSAQRIGSEPLLKAVEQSPSLRLHFLKFFQVKFVQAAYTSLANGRNVLTERLARWILMCADRVEHAEIEMTHAFLSDLLGVRRAGITTALHLLEGWGAVKSIRGRVAIRDRVKLEELSGGAYGVPEMEYVRLFGDPKSGSESTAQAISAAR